MHVCSLEVTAWRQESPADCQSRFKKRKIWERCCISSQCCLGNAAQRKPGGNQERWRAHSSSGSIFSHPIQPFEAMQPRDLMKKPLFLKVQNNHTRDVKTWQETKYPGSRAAEIGITYQYYRWRQRETLLGICDWQDCDQVFKKNG